MDTTDILIGTATVVLIFGGVPMGLAAFFTLVFHRIEIRDPDRFRDPARTPGNTVTAVAAVVAGVLLWAVWISWGNFAYPIWAVVGCVLASLAAVVGLGFLSRWRWSGPFVAALGGLLGFSTPCALQMGFSDDTGLWGVGYLILVVCAGVVLTLVATVVMAVRLRSRPRSRPRPRSRIPAAGRP